MVRGVKVDTPIGGIARKLWHVLRNVGHAPYEALTSDSDDPPGIRARMFGWPPPKFDPARETTWLDGLRGVAAFLVMTYHYHLSWYGASLEAPYGARGDMSWQIWRLPFLRIIMCSGHLQVSIFFVLSGFVLSWGPLSSIQSGRYEKLAQSLGSAVFRRWMRLFLPCFIIGFWALLEVWWEIELPTERKDTFLAQCWDYILECERFANPFHLERFTMEGNHKYSWIMWTIPFEFAGSLLVFTLLLGVGRIRRYKKRTMVVFGIVIYACISGRWHYWLFSTGLLLADYVRQTGGFEQLSHRTKRFPLIGWYLILIIGLYLGGVPEPNEESYTRPGYEFLDTFTPERYMEYEGGARFWWCWAGTLIVSSACHLVAIRQFFELPFARYLGRISFMLYLTHQMVNVCIGLPLRMMLYSLLLRREWSEEYESDIFVGYWFMWLFIYVVFWGVTGSVAVFVAHWCEVFVDRPCTRFARWVDDRFTKEEEEEVVPSIRLGEELGR